MKIKSMLFALILTASMSSPAFAQGYASDDDLADAMCVVSHIKKALNVQVNAWNTTNASDFQIALEIIEQYKKTPADKNITLEDHPSLIAGSVGSMVTAGSVFAYLQLKDYAALDNFRIFMHETDHLLAATIKKTNPEHLLALLQTQAERGESIIFLKEAVGSPKVTLVSDMALFHVYENIPEMKNIVIELQQLLPEVREVYTQSLELGNDGYSFCEQNKSYVKARELAFKLDHWTNQPQNLSTLKEAIQTTLHPESYGKFLNELTVAKNKISSFSAQHFTDSASYRKLWKISRITGAWGALLLVGGVAYELFVEEEPEMIKPEIWNMNEPDLRAYLRRLPEDVSMLKGYVEEVGCDKKRG